MSQLAGEGRSLGLPPAGRVLGGRGLLTRLLAGQMTLEDLWLLLPVPLLFGFLELAVIRPQDFWWHLRTGQIIVETGAVPTTDLLSFTRAGLPWINESWLMEVAYFLLYRSGGLPLVLFCHALTIAAGYWLLQRACLVACRGEPRAAALGTVAAAALGMAAWGVRPQSLSFLLFGAVGYVLALRQSGRQVPLLALPPLFALWANAHGAFIFGLAYLGIQAAAAVVEDIRGRGRLGREAAWLAAATLASTLALGLNPQGPAGMARYVLGFLASKPTVTQNLEFLPLTIREPEGALFFAVVGAIAWLAYRRRTASPALVGTLVVFALLSLAFRRALPWFGMAAAPALASLLVIERRTANGEKAGRAAAITNYAVVAVLVVLVVGGLPWLRPGLPLPAERRAFISLHETPEQGTRMLCALGSGVRVFNAQGYGGYLSWACPSLPVFIDSRIELYPPELWRTYILASNASYGWEAALAEQGVNVLFLSRQEQGLLVAAARGSTIWRLAWEDGDAAIFVRQGSAADRSRGKGRGAVPAMIGSYELRTNHNVFC